MPSADELIKAGDVAGARAALIEEVRAKPDDKAARIFLAQLLCVLGEWDKAQTHLRAAASAHPSAMMLSATLGQVILAEKAREDVFAGRAAPAALAGGDWPWMQALLAALAAETKGDLAAAGPSRAQAFEESPETPGHADGTRFDFLSDADARFGPCVEAIVDGRYGLVPFAAIAEIRTEGPKDLRDLVWLTVGLTFRTGASGMAFLPVRYPGAAADPDDLIKLARKTEWTPREGLGSLGRGQRVYDGDGRRSRSWASRRSRSTPERSMARFRPTLFDTLIGGGRAPEAPKPDAPSAEAATIPGVLLYSVDRLSESAYLDSVRRDLSWLLNAVRLDETHDLARRPEVRTSVLNYGIPDFSVRVLDSIDVLEAANEIRASVAIYEPRIEPKSLQVKGEKAASESGFQSLAFTIVCDVGRERETVRAGFRSEIDVETGRAAVRQRR